MISKKDHANSRQGVSMVQAPPTTLGGILRRLGPGLIIAGSIVGSGELIATTKTGAQAGMSLLWLIVVGCVIKVFVQIELGRYTITHGKTTLAALNTVPGPKFRVSWIVWFWLVMSLSTLAQLGGIVGGVGQSLAIAMPFTGDYQQAVRLPSQRELQRYIAWEREIPEDEKRIKALNDPEQQQEAQRLQKELQRKRNHQEFLQGMLVANDGGKEAVAAVRTLLQTQADFDAATRTGGDTLKLAELHYNKARTRVEELLRPTTADDKIWAAIVAVLTMGLLFRGRYSIVQNVATALVVLFTIITVGNVIALETNEAFRLTFSDFLRGFSLPEGEGALFTALATFGIIGVGASELVAYPYWCLEKGYARFTGPRSESAGWAQRARGWMRVMHYDAFVSMIIYTVATLAFFVMGVAVLHRSHLDPDGMRMVSTLLEQYRPVFDDYAQWLFLLGAISVLYSTFMVGTAGHSRTFTDCLKIFGLMSNDPKSHRLSVSVICLVVPLISLAIFCSGANPVTLVFVGATTQALMLPMLGFAAIYFRFRQSDERLKPSRLWDVSLVISAFGLLIAGGWLAVDQLTKKFLAG